MHCKFCGAPAFKDICPRHENEALFGKQSAGVTEGSSLGMTPGRERALEIVARLKAKASGISEAEWAELVAVIVASSRPSIPEALIGKQFLGAGVANIPVPSGDETSE